MKVYVCKHCGREDTNKQAHCSHQGACPKNENRVYNLGRWQLEGNVWNRGLTKDTDERVAKYGALVSASLRGMSTKGRRWNDASKKLLSHARLEEYATGIRKPYGGRGQKQWHYCQAMGKSVYLKSSWEVVFAKYCDLAGIVWEYEPLALVDSTGKTWHPDFMVDGELYDPGWQDKSRLQNVCESHGYVFNHVIHEEIQLMRKFL